MNIPSDGTTNDIGEKNKKVEKEVNTNSELSSNQKKNKNKICLYCISCFHKYIWNNELYTLSSLNPEIISIDIIQKENLFYDNNFEVIIHKINLGEKIKKINLILDSKMIQKNWNLNEIIIKPEKEKVLLADLDINLNIRSEFIKDLKDFYKKDNNDNNLYKLDKISRILKLEEKLNIYLNFFNKVKIENELKQNLASQFLSTIKDDSLVIYSDILTIFTLAFGTKVIIEFLDKYTKFSYNLVDKVDNKDFNKILNLYKNDKNQFFKTNESYFKKIKNINKKEDSSQKYDNLLENFITIYQLLYEETANIDKPRLIKVKPVLISIINNKNDLNNYISLIESKFDSFYKVLSINNNEKVKVQSKLIENKHLIYEQFEQMYKLLLKEQENKGKFIFDFSEIIDYFLNETQNCLDLINLKKTFKTELTAIPNKDLEKKIKDKIHYSGLQNIQNGNYDNLFLIRFIRYNDYFKPQKENKNYEKEKYHVIRCIKIDLMDENFYKKYNEYKIYNYFEENFVEYLRIYFEDLKEMKYFGYFFKLLPNDKYNKDTINFMIKWMKNNIITFSKEQCPNFDREIKELFLLILNKKLIGSIYPVIEILKINLKEYSINLFIFLLNSLENNLNEKIVDSMLSHVLCPNINENDFLNIDNILKNVTPNKLISKALLKNLENFSINLEDFFQERSQNFSIFEKLLKNNNYSLLKDENNKNSIYWENSLNTCKTLSKDLNNLNLIFLKIINTFNIIGKENIIKRMSNIFMCLKEDNYNIKAISIVSRIEEILEKWKENINKIENLKKYYISTLNNFTKINEELSTYNKKIMNSSLQYLESQKGNNEFIKYKAAIEKAKEFEKLKKSNVFLNIFIKTKNSTDSKKRFELALEKFKNIKKIFVNDKKKIAEELKKNKQIKHLINIGYQNQNNLEKEINYILEYFSIYDFKHKDYLIERIKMHVENKSFFSVVSGLLILFDNYKNILNFNDNDSINFHKEFEEYKKLLRIKEFISDDIIHKIAYYLESKFKINFENKENKFNFFNLFIAINQYPKSLDFLKDKKSEQVKNLNEFLLESDDTPLSDTDINDYIKVVSFFEDIISNKNDIKTFFDFVIKIVDGTLDKNKCGKRLINYIQKYNFIQTLFTKYLNHTEGCIKKINNILVKSYININLKDDKIYILEGGYSNPNDENIIEYKNSGEKNEVVKNELETTKSMNESYTFFFYNDLESIFQRVFIAKISEKYKENVDKYIIFFKNVKQLIKILNDLFIKGYQEEFEISLNFNNTVLTCNYQNEKNKKIEEMMKFFFELKRKVFNIVNNYLNKSNIIRFFYGRQLYLIYNNITNDNEIKNLDLFKVNFNNAVQYLKPKSFKFTFCGCDHIKFENIIQQIDKYLEHNLNLNNKKINDIYEPNKIILLKKPLQSNLIVSKHKEKENEYKGIYFYISHKNQEVESLSLYFVLTKNLPINSCFLYCTKETNNEELNIFLLRCFLCEVNALFCMVNINLLNNSIRRTFISYIKYYSNKYGKTMKSCLIMIFSAKDDDLHKIFIKTKNISAFMDTFYFSYLFYFDQDYYNNYKVELIKSANCGLGKSEFIKSQKSVNEDVKKKAKNAINYIYFPLGGQFSRNSLIKRISDLPDMSDINQKYCIHFDITQTNEIELLNEFFFKLLVLRKCDLNENAKYFGKNVEIIIEVPNDFRDYRDEIGILLKLKKTNNLDKIGKVNITPELKIVANTLTMYETNDILKSQKEINNIKLVLSQEECQNKVLKYLKNINVDDPNYYQVNIFIKVLSDQFSKFLKCPGYTVDDLIRNAIAKKMSKEDAIDIRNLRKFIIDSLVKVTRLFLIGPYEKLIKSQEINQKLSNENEEKKNNLINNHLKIDIDSISFDIIRPSLVVFNEDGASCTIITTCNEKDSEFENLKKLYNSQNPFKDKDEELKSFRKLNKDQISENLLRFLNVTLNEEKKKEILGTYVYTPDNFIKVVLILLRIRVKIPIILMGETGCGKTTLIEMASKLINKGKSSIYKMNIHAGIADEDIINFMKEVNESVEYQDKILFKRRKDDFDKQSEEDKKAYLRKNSLEQIYEQYKNEINNRKIWIFFDEINTCNSMGLLIEIFCKNSINGKPLDKRYVYIGACNPYRVSQKENKVFSILYKKQHKKKNLVYTVNPLPFTLLNFVFNFGSLKEKDELEYIESMITGTANKLFEKLNDYKFLKEKEKIINIEKVSVELCQKYMKKNNDISIVSLREVNRFNILFEFFVDYINKRKNNQNFIQNSFEEEEIIKYYNSKSEIEIFYNAINLSLFVCYYLRLPDKESRKELENELNDTKFFSEGDFLKVPLMEENYMLNNFDIPKGIAKNRNLKENIFILFICIINKIPLITCGKPGRSKTLSFQIIQNSMKGEGSKTLFCKQYKEIIAFQIQGSLNTTSAEITEIFKKGREHQKSNLKDKIVVIFMDEMGLAEISENNPLKVLHSELEQETDKVSFVGISNWFIDASKMNRVIYNVVQDPDEEDIIETGKEIAKSYEVNGENYSQKYEDIILRLSKAYFKYISKKKKENDKDQYFHGSRDFYSLIKSVLNDLIKNKNLIEKYDKEEDEDKKNKLLNDICLNQIMRNFGGLENSIDEFISYFFEEYNDYNNLINNNKYNVMKCIQENINDNESRYLLLIIDNYLSLELLNYILDEIKENNNILTEKNNNINIENKEKDGIEIYNIKNNAKYYINKKYYSGSKFKGDRKNIMYSEQILNKIKFHMENSNILILKDLETVYPALYELFNQSFIYLDGKKFVHLGKFKSLALVDDKIKIIVLVQKNKIDSQEPPFLNRFEKHIINISNLLNEELLKIAEEIYNTLKEINNIIIKDSNNKKIDIEAKFKKYLNFIKEEEIQGLVYIASRKINIKDENSKSNIIQFVLDKIVPCFTEELMILFSKFNFRNEYDSYFKFIYEIYKEKYCYNFKNYLEKLSNETSIVYTFSSFLDNIMRDETEIIKNITSDINFSKISTNEININSISTMDQIDKEIIDFLFNEEKNCNDKDIQNLLILKFREEDLNKLNDIYYLLNEYRTNIRKKPQFRQIKIVIFVIYLQKNSINSNYISFLSNYPQIMIKNFNNKFMNFPKILISSNKEIIKNQLFDTNSIINNNIEDVLRYFNYKLTNCDNEQKICYRQTISFFIKQNTFLKNILVECLTLIIKNDDDFLIKYFKEEIFEKDEKEESNLMNSLLSHINSIVFDNLRKIIYFLEKEQIINVVSFNEKLCQNEIIQKYVIDFISKIDNLENKKFNWKTKNINQKVNIEILLEQKLPLCEKYFKSIFIYSQNNIANKYLEKDSYFFNTKIKDSNIDIELKKYSNEIKKLDDNLKIELSKYKMIIEILNSKNELLISSLFEDCFFVFFKKNNKLKSKYGNLAQLLNLMIQLRLKTRMNNNLNIDFIDKEKIELSKSFIDIIREEEKDTLQSEENNDDNEKNKINDNIYIDKFVDIINFLQSYSKEIYFILELYHFLLNIIPCLYDNIISIIKEKKVEMEKDPKRNPYSSKINKVSFFYIIESLCKILKEQLINILNNRDNQLYIKKIEFFNSIQYHIQNLLKLEKRFLLFSKEIFSLEIIMKINNQIQLNNKNYNFIELSIEALSLFLKEYKKENLVEILFGQYFMLSKIFKSNLDIFGKLMNKVLLNYYKSESNNEIRERLIKKYFLEDKLPFHNNLIEYSYPLVQLIFRFSSLEPSLKEVQKTKFFDNFNIEDSIKKAIDDSNDSNLNEIFLYRFEIVCENYFKTIQIEYQNNQDKAKLYSKLCGGEFSKKYLEYAIKYFYNLNYEQKVNFKNIFKLYCIAYIKRYLNYYIDILYDKEKYQQFSEREDVNIILFSNKGNEKIIAYYCLKLLLKKSNSWDNFIKYFKDFKNNEADYLGLNKADLKINFEKDESLEIKPILLLDLKKSDREYNELLSKNDLNEKDKKTFHNLFLKDNSYDYLYTFLSNILILYYSTSTKNEDKKKNYKQLINKIISKKESFNQNSFLFFNIFFEENNFKENIVRKMGISKDEINKLDKLSRPKITILLYSLRFIFSLLNHAKYNKKETEGFYFNLLTKNISSIIDSNFIPGNFPYYSLKIESFYEIKKLLQADHYKYGAYLCSCGYHYSIDKCTFPTIEFKCPICKKYIGGKKHILVRREGHIRVFFDDESRRVKLNHSYADKTIPNKLLNELENEINIEKKQLEKGIKPVDITFFVRIQEKVREMSEITYRFLNFILYSFLFYSNIKGFIKDKNLNKYLINSKTCFEIIEKNWEIMKKLLDNIRVEIFLNLIYDEIIQKLIACPIMTKNENAINFEKSINEIIINKLKDKEAIKEIEKRNDDIININPNSDKAIVQELFSYDQYSQKDFPYLKYFYTSEFPGKEHFIFKFNSIEKNKENYPILNTIINNNELKEKLNLMKYLPTINRLCNHMINYVSFKFSREEAKKILIKNEVRDGEILSLLDEFVPIYKKIRPFIKQQGCHEFGGLFLDLTDNLYLSNLCVDSGELGFGLVLLAMYEEMSDWQNSFINSVINSSNEHLNYYKDLFNSKIMIQDCEEDQILKLPTLENIISLRKDKKFDLFEIILNNSRRKGNIIIYDYDEIEDELASYILPNIKAFKSEFRKVIYQYECFVGDRSSIIINFMEKYQQRELNEIELKNVVKYLMENKKNNKFNIKNFLVYLQVLIDSILDFSPKNNETLYSFIEREEKENLNNVEEIKDFLKVMNEYKSNDNFNENDNNNYFDINCLISLIDIVEMFCWDTIKENLDKRYLEDINENIQIRIKAYYDEKNNNEDNNIIITKIDLCSAIRKFISRYLSGKSDESLNPKNKLKNYLINIELWPINFAENDIIEEEINKIFGEVDVEIAQSKKLFEFLGGDISKLEEIKKKYEEKEKKKPLDKEKDKDEKKDDNNDKENQNKIIENEEEERKSGKDLNFDENKEEEKEDDKDEDIHNNEYENEEEEEVEELGYD